MMMNQSNITYKNITFWENRRRLKLLFDFKELVKIYFDNIRVTGQNGDYIEEKEAKEARVAIDRAMFKAYRICKLANMQSHTASHSLRMVRGNSNNSDVILNIFNFAKKDITPESVIGYIERVIDVYKINYERRKKYWLYMASSKVAALVVVIVSIVLFMNSNKDPQRTLSEYPKTGTTASQMKDPYDETINELMTRVSSEKGLVSDRCIISEEAYQTVSYANKTDEQRIDDNQYASQSIYTIQTGSFLEIERAQKEFNAIQQKLNAKELAFLRIEKIDKYFSVRLGKFESFTNTETFLEKIKPQLSSAIIKKAYYKNERILRLHKNSISQEITIAYIINQ